VLFWRPMLFASADPVMAQASGILIRAISVLFAVLVGLAAAQSVQIVGALLVMALLITPGAAAVQITSSPLKTVFWSVLFAEISSVGFVILFLATALSWSVLVTTISFALCLGCSSIGVLKNRQAVRDDIAARCDKEEFTAVIDHHEQY